VLFTGFKAWTRHYQFWSTTDDNWGFSLASYAVLAAFLLLVLGSYFVIGQGFMHPDSELSVLRGAAPILPKPVERKSKIREMWSAVLNSI
jgi:hypothetical protein